MRNFILLSTFFTILIFSSAEARDYYNGESYNESPRYHRITNSEARQYREKQICKDNAPVISNNTRFYIGADMIHSQIKFNDERGINKDNFDDDMLSFSGVVGIKFNKYLGAEAYYQQSQNAKKNYDYVLTSDNQEIGREFSSTSINYKSYGMDLMGYLPINQEIELLAALGVGLYDFEAKGPGVTSISKNFDHSTGLYDININTGTVKKYFDSLGIRAGLGAQYNVTDHVALRGMVRYIRLNSDDYVKNLIEASLGVRYMF